MTFCISSTFLKSFLFNDVSANNMRQSPSVVTPHQINVTDIFPVEHTEQVAAFMLHQEIEGFLHLALELVVDVSKHTTPYGLWFFIVHSLLRFLLVGFRLRSLLLRLLLSNALLFCLPFCFNTSFFLRLFCSNPLRLFLLCLNASLLLFLSTFTLLSGFPFFPPPSRSLLSIATTLPASLQCFCRLQPLLCASKKYQCERVDPTHCQIDPLESLRLRLIAIRSL